MDASEASWLTVIDRARAMEPDPDLVDLDDAQLEQHVRDAAAQIAAATCQYLLLVAELVVRGVWADQHARTPGEWLSWACGTALNTAREHVRVGLALRDAPLIRERFAAGTISYSKVRAITRVVAPGTESELLALADSATASQLDRIIAACRRQLSAQEGWARGPDDVPPDVRDFSTREIDPETVEIRIRLSPDEAAAYTEGLDRLVDLADWATDDDRGGDDAVSGDEDAEGQHEYVPIGVRRAAAAVDAIATAVAAGPPDRSGADGHLIVLHVQVDDLVAAAADAGSIDAPQGDVDSDGGSDAPAGASPRVPSRRTGGPSAPRRHVVTGRARAMHVPNSALAHLTCDAELRIAGIHDRDGHGHPADIGRRSRTVPAALRRALLLRDRSCRFPGCHRTRQLHAHHVWHWADGGPTDLANLVLLCSHHHRVVHRQGWRLEAVDPSAGRWTFHAPGSDDPHMASPPLPGAPAGACAEGLPDPHPRSLQPPWWDGEGYDVSETVRVVATYLRDLSPVPVDRPPHPALA